MVQKLFCAVLAAIPRFQERAPALDAPYRPWSRRPSNEEWQPRQRKIIFVPR